MNKVSNKQVFLVVLLIGIVACLLVYMLVFTKYNDLTEEVKKSNEQLQVEVDDMKQYFDNMETYLAGIKRMEASVTEMTKDYPGDAREEDALMMALDMATVAIINYDKINVKSPEIISFVPEETVIGAGVDGYEEQIDFVMRQATYSNTTSYSSMKRAIEKVYESPYRIGVNAIAYKKDSESNNYINGTIDICYYSIRGMGKTYDVPEMPTYFGGGTDLFGLQHWALTEEDISELVQ